MRIRARITIAGAVVLALAATTARVDAQATKENDKQDQPKPPKPSADLITISQIQARTFNSVYDVIEALHSNWLRSRNLNPPPGSIINPGTIAGQSSSSGSAPPSTGLPRDANGIQVYVDGTRVGGIESLKALPTTNIYTIRRINGTDAQQRFGIGHSDGVIYIATAPNKNDA